MSDKFIENDGLLNVIEDGRCILGKELHKKHLLSQSIEEGLKEEFRKWHSAETTFAIGVPNDISIAEWWLEKLSLARTEEFQKGKNWAKDMAYNAWIPCAVAEYKAEIKKLIQNKFESFTLQDWSGEGEVYDEIKRLKDDIINLIISPNKE